MWSSGHARSTGSGTAGGDRPSPMRPILTALALAMLAGCGGDDAAPTSSQSLGDDLGCDSFTEGETDELFVRDLYECERDGETTNVYTFASSSARDSWREVAEEFGTTVVDEGDTWLEVE